MLGITANSTNGGKNKKRNIVQHSFRCGDTCIDLNDSCKCGEESFGHKENLWCCHDFGTCRELRSVTDLYKKLRMFFGWVLDTPRYALKGTVPEKA